VLDSVGVDASGPVVLERPRVGWSPIMLFGSAAMLLLCVLFVEDRYGYVVVWTSEVCVRCNLLIFFVSGEGLGRETVLCCVVLKLLGSRSNGFWIGSFWLCDVDFAGYWIVNFGSFCVEIGFVRC